MNSDTRNSAEDVTKYLAKAIPKAFLDINKK